MDHLVPDDGLAVIAALAAHPFAEVDRMMNDDEREGLKASIKASCSGICNRSFCSKAASSMAKRSIALPINQCLAECAPQSQPFHSNTPSSQ